MPEKLISHSGNYRKLLSYQKTEVIYEMTYYFCHTYLKYGDRTIDQMVQAARSGKQNIVEGCGGLCRIGNFGKNRNKTAQCGESKFAGIARRLYRLSSHSQP